MLRQKTSILGHLLAGPIGHVAVNALGRAAHHGSNLADVLAHRGLQHGLLEAVTNPAAMRSVKSLAGAESVVPYEMAHQLGTKLRGMDPTARQTLLQQIHGGTATQAPVLSSVRNAVGHELHSTEPTLRAHGLPAKIYAHAVDKMTGIANKPFDTTMQRAVRTTLGGAPLAGAVALDPVGAAAHIGVNATREGLGRSAIGKRFTEKTFEHGLTGGTIPRAHEFATDYLASPAVLDPYRAGRTLRQEATPQIRTQLTAENVARARAASKRPDISAGLQQLRTQLGPS